EGDLFVDGCSTSEVAGEQIGTSGSEEVAEVIFKELKRLSDETGVALCLQCCEHLNRAIVVDKDVMHNNQLDMVSAVPVRQSGGSMSAYAFQNMEEAVLVENILAEAGMDIGDTMVGMQLKPVAIPLRFEKR